METSMFILNVTHFFVFLMSVVYLYHVKQACRIFLINKVIFCVQLCRIDTRILKIQCIEAEI